MREQQRVEESKAKKLPVWTDSRTPPAQSGWMNYLYSFEFKKHPGKDPRSFDEDTLN
jgi:hypothetical protein